MKERHMKTLTTAPVLLVALALAACAGRPLKGGRATTTTPIQQTLRQSDNPSASSCQTQETIRTRTYSLPPQLPQQGEVGHAPTDVRPAKGEVPRAQIRKSKIQP